MHPILFRIGTFPIGTYGLMLALAFFAALALAKRLSRQDGLDPEAIGELSLTLLLAGIIGSKALMIVVDLVHGAPAAQVFTLDTLRAGGAIHGGVLGAALAFAWVLRRYKLPLRATGDALVPAVALGQGIGRLGCFFAGCCFGTECHLPWAVTFTNPDALSQGTPLGAPLHPVQLYTLLANLAVMAALLLLRRKKPFPGFVFASYFVLEGLGRMVTETWRDDPDRGVWLNQPWLSTGRLTGLGFAVAGLVLLALWRRSRPATETP